MQTVNGDSMGGSLLSGAPAVAVTVAAAAHCHWLWQRSKV